jgi:hypothetical protein
VELPVRYLVGGSDRSMQAVPVSVNKTEDTRPAAFKKRASPSPCERGACRVQQNDLTKELRADADSSGNVAASHESNVAT